MFIFPRCQFFSRHIDIRKLPCDIFVCLVLVDTGIDLCLQDIDQLDLMIEVRNIPLLLCQYVQFILNVKQSFCHCALIPIPTGTGQKCFLYDLLDQQILYYFSGRLIICLKISTDMTLCLIDSTNDLPVALMQTIFADEPLVLPFPLKQTHFKAHILMSKLLNVGF